MTMTRDKEPKARGHVRDCLEALVRIAAALNRGEPVLLEDAKVLEAAGCWLRRNMTEQN
jgi:hypothetical protein